MKYSASIIINDYHKLGVSLFDFQRIINSEEFKEFVNSGNLYGELLDRNDYDKMSSERINNVDKDKAIIKISGVSLEVSSSGDTDDKFIVVNFESTGAHPYYDKLLSDKYFYKLNLRIGREHIADGVDRPTIVAIDIIPRITLAIGNNKQLRYERLFNKK